MAITFLVLSAFMLAVTAWKPLKEPVVLPVSDIDVRVLPSGYLLGGLIIAMTVALYVVFW